jgi:hypothetical protein
VVGQLGFHLPLQFFAIPVTVRVAGMNVKRIENHVLLHGLFGEGI